MTEPQSTAAQKASNKFWNEKPTTKFCVGFCTFVIAEILEYVTHPGFSTSFRQAGIDRVGMSTSPAGVHSGCL
jgi:hypothetical protein